MAGHAEPLYDTVFVVTVSHPVIVLVGALYRQVVDALNGDTDEYVPPDTDTPGSALHALRPWIPPLYVNVPPVQ